MEIITNDIDDMVSSEQLLSIIKEGFEEVEGIKILSLCIHENEINGLYIIPPQQVLSFIQMPRFDITVTLGDKNIWIKELGQVLYGAYRSGNITDYDLLTTPSDIKIVSNLFDTLVSKCLNNPPQNQINANLLSWLKLTPQVSNLRTQTFCEFFKMYKKIDDTININTDISTKSNTESQILNEFSNAISELESLNAKKNSELILNQIDEMYITLQLDLYACDDI